MTRWLRFTYVPETPERAATVTVSHGSQERVVARPCALCEIERAVGTVLEAG